MAQVSALNGPVRGRVLALLARVPAGRVTTPDAIATVLGIAPPLVTATLARLSDDERQMHPWYRVVASGGAIGRGPWREAQFARLLREGIAVSPAGIVQDMGRVFVGSLADLPAGVASEGPQDPTAAPKGRSRGMKDRPGA